MFFLYAIELFGMAVVAWTLLTQVFYPLMQGRPMFPILKNQGRLE